uniref:SMB domain-containing protein n=1 Tax=Sus scrofa TaxID=9823 RepID=A0A8D1JNS3_PIG
MAPLRPLLMLALLAWVALADQESCKGRCTDGFIAERKCQCDELCSYYQSCCTDYVAECKPQVTRGDVFLQPDDEYRAYDYHEETRHNTSVQEEQRIPVLLAKTEETPVLKPEEEAPPPGPQTDDLGVSEEELCSGKPFDAFTNLKNGSVFAFRGLYCYELDEKAVRPGYPKLIQDVWGIKGPIDAAFTRINCQGKTYLFKGSQYWRFDDGVLDPNYPREISEGFKGIPDDVDAALALPAHSYSGRERVYFFKGTQWVGGRVGLLPLGTGLGLCPTPDQELLTSTASGLSSLAHGHPSPGKQYWEYVFQQQPSREECEGSSPSDVFAHFALMQRDSWEDIFRLLFWSHSFGGAIEPRVISQDWLGLPEQVDAAMAGQIYISGSALKPSQPKMTKSARRSGKRYRSRRGRGRGRGHSRSQKSHRQSRSTWLPWFSSEETGPGGYNYDDYKMDWLVPATCEPIQSVYFFSGEEYYRVNLRTQRVDTVTPPYPRSIAQYWLGCPVPDQK